VFTGRQAKDHGLVDRLGTLDDAIDEAKKLAGMDDDEPIDRVLLPEAKGLFDELFGAADRVSDPLAAVAAAVRGVPAGSGAAVDAVAGRAALAAFAGELDAIVLLLSGRPQLMMPVRVRVR
jgi:ClpP class serine protease